MTVLDLFAGPGGWDLAARSLGLDPLGIEIDGAACATREAAGLRTLQADVSVLDPTQFDPVDGLIASPPCQAWSMAGKRGGERDKELVYKAARGIADDRDRSFDLARRCEDPRSMLVVEPLRWALALRPQWIALEQVPPVLEFWQFVARTLREHGYSVWTGILEAERYGVPQTRERAILMARLDGEAHPPAPTHQRYVTGVPAQGEHPLDGTVIEPWISMAEALGWGLTERPSPPVLAKVGGTGGNRPLEGGSGGRAMLRRERARGAWLPDDRVGFPRRDDLGGDGYRERDTRLASEPAFALTEKARSWTRQTEAETVRVQVEEAAVLQGFPPGYPFQGTRTKQFEQVGNAIPPPLARAVLEVLVDAVAIEEAA